MRLRLLLSAIVLLGVSLVTAPVQAAPTSIPTAPYPWGVDFSRDGSFAYVTGGYTTSRLDPTTDAVVATIATNQNGSDVAISPDGSFAYVTDYNGQAVERIRTSDNTRVATVPLGSNVYDVAISPDGTFAYVTTFVSNSVLRIRTSDDTVVASIPVGRAAYGVAFSPDGSFAYVTNAFGASVSRIRTADDTVTATIPVGATPIAVSIAPDGSFAYVVNYGGNSVSRIRTSDDTVTATIPVGRFPYDVAFTPDGTSAVVTNSGGNSVTRLCTAADIVSSTSPVGAGPRGVAVSPNGEFAYVSNFLDSSVSRVALPAVECGGPPVDQTPPSVAVVGVTSGERVVLGRTPQISCTADDAQSGLAEPCRVVVSGGNANGVGDFAATATATDRAGNSATAVVRFRIVYNWAGFEQPLTGTAHEIGVDVSGIRAGSTVPVRFRITDASGAVVQPLTAPRWMTPVPGGNLAAPAADGPFPDASPTSLVFRSTGSGWHFGWDTSRSQAGHYWRIGVQLDDGEVHVATVALR